MTKSAAQKAYAKAGIKPSDVQVVELHGKRFLWFYKFWKTKVTHGIILWKYYFTKIGEWLKG